METESIRYICKFTSELSKKEIEDFTSGLFGDAPSSHDYGLQWFNWLYKDNIFGDSIHVIAYYKDEVAGKRSLWRNDLEPKFKAYQPINTYVSPNMRRKGIFYKMNEYALDKAQGCYIYNFPNRNSAPGYLKSGWKVKEGGFSGIYIGLKGDAINALRDTPVIPKEYLIWRFINSPVHKYCYTKFKGQYILLREKQLKFNVMFYVVVGRITQDCLNKLSKVNPFWLFTYDSGNRLISVRKNKCILVENTLYKEFKGNIPLWRADTV